MRLTSRGRDAFRASSQRPRLPRRWSIAGIALAMLAVYWLDRATDAAPVQHLYYAPIIASAIRFRTPGGLAAATTAIILYHLANPATFAFPYAHGDVVQVLLFVAVPLVTAKLTSGARHLHTLAMTDDLTGLHNLRSFEAQLKDVVTSAGATGTPLSLLVLDMDHLKQLNDRYGHLTGADAVRTVGHIIASDVTPGAVACPYGGDEFVIALPRCSEREAVLVANRVRESVTRTAPLLAGRSFPAGTLSISVGVACRSFSGASSAVAASESAEHTGEELFSAADGALYAAKDGGRNRVEMVNLTVSA